MTGLGNIEEVLWVAAPELVLSTIIMNALPTCRHLIPLARESLLDRLGYLDKFDGLGSEDS